MKKRAIKTRLEGKNKLWLSVRFDQAVPLTAGITATFSGINSKGEAVTKTLALSDVTRVWSDRLEGWLDLTEAIQDYFADDFSVSSGIALSVTVSIEDDDDPPIVIEDSLSEQAEWAQATATLSHERLWPFTYFNSTSIGGETIITSALIDSSSLVRFALAVSANNLFPQCTDPRVMTPEAFDELFNGAFTTEDSGIVCLIIDGDTPMVKIPFFNGHRKYFETYSLEDFYTVRLSGGNEIAFTSSDAVLRVEEGTPLPYLPGYTSLPPLTGFTASYQAEVNADRDLANAVAQTDIRIYAWEAPALGAEKHNPATGLGSLLVGRTT